MMQQPKLRVTDAFPINRTKEVEEQRCIAGIKEFLSGLGFDQDNEHLQDTPERVARAWIETFTAGYDQSVEDVLGTQFVSPEANMIVVSNISFVSMCAHHFLPVIGVAKVGYIPSRTIVGISKLARLVDLFARRPQIQELMVKQIADGLDATLKPHGVGVSLVAEHTCMTIRGVMKSGAVTTTNSFRGLLLTEATARAEFLDYA